MAELSAVFAGYDALIYALGPDERHTPPAPAAEFFQQNLVDTTERVVQAARAAGVSRAVICSSYFVTWDRMHPELSFAENNPYVQARVDQGRRAVAAGGGPGATQVCLLEIPYVFGVVPQREPLWKHWLFERLKAMPVVCYPSGGSSVVTAAQVGQAAAAAARVGEHGARYPLADEQLTWTELLKMILPLLGKPPIVLPAPRIFAELAVGKIGRDAARAGLEPGVNPRLLMRQVMYRQMFVDPAESLRVLGYRRGGVRAAIEETVRASYPAS